MSAGQEVYYLFNLFFIQNAYHNYYLYIAEEPVIRLYFKYRCALEE